MTETKVALVTETDCISEISKAKKEEKIREKYKAELGTLRVDCFSPHLGPIFSSFLGGVPGLSKSQLSPTDFDLVSSPIHVISSDLDLEVEDILLDVTSILSFLTH